MEKYSKGRITLNTFPLIFLDVDGALNSHQWFEKREKMGIKYQEGDDFLLYMETDIDPEAVKRVKRICDSTGAKIVISSVWQKGRLYDVLLKVFAQYNLKNEVIGVTGNQGCKDCLRGNVILRWIQDNVEDYHSFKKYVIIDDDSDMLYWQKDNFVQTSSENGGLTDELVDKAIKILLR
jgi:ribosomal protein L31